MSERRISFETLNAYVDGELEEGEAKQDEAVKPESKDKVKDDSGEPAPKDNNSRPRTK